MQIENKVVIAGLHDKGKAAIIELQTTSYEKESGEALCMNRVCNFSGAPYTCGVRVASLNHHHHILTQAILRARFLLLEFLIVNLQPHMRIAHNSPRHALLYRLSGDYNPLHSDPMVANIAGFNRPILHGLCSFGFAVRAVIKSFCNGEPSSVKSVFGRFLLHVYPGETLITEMWINGSRVVYRTSVKERGRAVLTGYVVLREIPSSL
ncbi:hypothetical protein Taro_045905 [Colocasia esculenta]|uniref:MaoC-like domain-containing protein n=1 Tax=Colocasia esculenta TaxID=4460 RepID=A0A843X4W4_COLES|nr:hypothetical protein [Colocasia esculenta]